jgi:hypothetical protein
MSHLTVYSLFTLCVGVVGAAVGQSKPAATASRTREPFSFVVSAPYADVFPLFGAHKERVWAAGFDPQFIYPTPPNDEPGMVFTTVQQGLSRYWVNTAFDAESGHVQYVYWIPDVMVALIDIHVVISGANETKVSVVSERTALRPEANDQVLQMAHQDAKSGPHWAEMINGYLQEPGAK